MTAPNPTDDELLAWLDEMLPVEQSTRIEQLLRDRSELRQRAALLARRRDAGGHTVGEIWRRHRLSCLSRSQLGEYLLGVADADLEHYIQFHTQEIGCRLCQANLEDLRAARQAQEPSEQRRQRYFESSAGLLRSRR
jgi:hypothetical protein